VRDNTDFPVMCVDRTVRKFDFRTVIRKTPDNWRPVERRSCSDRY